MPCLALLLLFLVIGGNLRITALVMPAVLTQREELLKDDIERSALLIRHRTHTSCQLFHIAVQRAFRVVIQIQQFPVQRPFNER
ncbi:hypothetical protein BMF29_07600 [Comamonas kerstersii]|nr:hypothetical protein BMF29_07600 [Comamonas kerstersii]